MKEDGIAPALSGAVRTSNIIVRRKDLDAAGMRSAAWFYEATWRVCERRIEPPIARKARGHNRGASSDYEAFFDREQQHQPSSGTRRRHSTAAQIGERISA